MSEGMRGFRSLVLADTKLGLPVFGMYSFNVKWMVPSIGLGLCPKSGYEVILIYMYLAESRGNS